MKNFTAKLAENDAEFKRVRQIWQDVFVDEQHIPEDKVFEGDSGSGKHEVIALAGTEIIGTARIVFPERHTARIERMAILEPYRRTGAGKTLIAFIIALLKEQQVAGIILHAQHTAVPFYRSCGFSAESDWFVEAGIRHIRMRLAL